MAAHCCVSWTTLEAAFRDYRGITPVAHARNMPISEAIR
jgi:nicotinamidase-related amidase